MVNRRSKRGSRGSEDLLVFRPGVDDMTLLTKSDPPGIMANLKERLEARCIYTYIGGVLVAMNPFTWLEIYGPEAAKRYTHVSRLDVPPHVFAVAEEAFRSMTDEEESQCIIISGESGAGKTEASKQIQSYLSIVSAGKGSKEVERVKKVFLESNPLLEAFGNAKTLRNNNSSRFGKYFELLFDRFGTPRGGIVTNYLLEKSRTVKPGTGERNFHIFYQLVQGADTNLRKNLGLAQGADQYPTLSTCLTVDGHDDGEDFRETKQALDDVGVPANAIHLAYRAVAACLALAQIKFKPLQVGDAEGNEIIDASPLKLAAQLIGLHYDTIINAMATRRLETMAAGGKKEKYQVPLNPTQAALARDALIKSLYSKLFDSMVYAVNVALDPPEIGQDDEDLLSIGVLDIYGFEIFDKNGFEQLSINFVNEKLQQIFIALTLKAEQEEYVAEGIQWKEVKYFNNKIVCELIENKKPPGVLLVLDDVCKQMHSRPGAQIDAKFLDTVASCHSSHRHFIKTKQGFTIKHYAGDVEYNSSGFAESNRDELRSDLLDVILASSDTSLVALYNDDVQARDLAAQAEAAGQRQKTTQRTAGRKIREQCSDLVSALMICEPHYVRCVKSNENKAALNCDDERVTHQVKYLGLPENVRVRRAGFAYRTEYHRFLERFKVLSTRTYPAEWTGSDKDGARCIVEAATKLGQSSFADEPILKHLAALGNASDTQFGRTKLFVKQPEVYFALEKAREHKFAAYASKIARSWRKANDMKESIIIQRDLARKYSSIGKRRRASSVDRPYLSDYLRDDDAAFRGARRGLHAILKHYNDDEGRILFLDPLTRILRKNPTPKKDTPPGFFLPRVLAVTSNALYLIEKCSTEESGAKHRVWQLRRRLELREICGLIVSRAADDIVVLKVRGERGFIKADKKALIDSGKWQKNADIKVCPITGKNFGLLSAKRHHCRASGRIYAAEACETRQTFPDDGWHQPERVSDALVGLHSSEPREDIALSLERRSELVAVLIKANNIKLRGENLIDLEVSASPLSITPKSLEFGIGTAKLESRPPQITGSIDKFQLDAPIGVDETAAQAKRQRADDRRARRAEARRQERERRRQRDAERDALRREERRKALREKKARKAAEREARARAAGATIISGSARRRGIGRSGGASSSSASGSVATYSAPKPQQQIRDTAQPIRQPAPPPTKNISSKPPPPMLKTEPPKVPSQLSAASEYYWQHLHTGAQCGPSTLAELKAKYEGGETNNDCLVYAAGVVEEWKTIGQVPILAEYLAAKPKPTPPKPKPPPPAKKPPPPPAAPPSSSQQQQSRPRPAQPVAKATTSSNGGSVNSELAAKLARRRAAAGE
uniref:Myosin motor domain-containing protein n=1 Tax=Aureoumbra lagunensis TaxID=44058 RepID=A0A7S3NLZ4_9STRA